MAVGRSQRAGRRSIDTGEDDSPLDGVDISVPLAVDLDRTLLLTDTLHEGFAHLAIRRPFVALASLAYLGKGRAAFKRRLGALDAAATAALPRRLDLIGLLEKEKARGRPIHLVSAADQAMVEAVAREIGVFDSAVGSDGRRNLKGAQKLAFLQECFPDGFLYAGDHASDLPIF